MTVMVCGGPVNRKTERETASSRTTIDSTSVGGFGHMRRQADKVEKGPLFALTTTAVYDSSVISALKSRRRIPSFSDEVVE